QSEAREGAASTTGEATRKTSLANGTSQTSQTSKTCRTSGTSKSAERLKALGLVGEADELHVMECCKELEQDEGELDGDEVDESCLHEISLELVSHGVGGPKTVLHVTIDYIQNEHVYYVEPVPNGMHGSPLFLDGVLFAVHWETQAGIPSDMGLLARHLFREELVANGDCSAPMGGFDTPVGAEALIK
ncbi:unnamed protein product, partial [Chrysoparadoxa australica]